MVLGTRSAVFAPLKNLGLIVLDEEQESSYQIGKRRPGTTPGTWPNTAAPGITPLLVLGSATPAVETPWTRRSRGSTTRSLLRRRYNEQALPQVLIADHETGDPRRQRHRHDRAGPPGGAGGKPASGESRAFSF